ncbi:MAG: hypothetical protein AAF593_13550 [Planctomycetota bacterium]
MTTPDRQPPEPPIEPPIEDPELEAYLDGTMSAEDLDAFNARLEREPGLRQQIQQQQGIDAALRQAFSWTSTEQALPLPDENKQNFNPTAPAASPYRFPGPKFRTWALRSAIAAVLALAATTVFFITTSAGDVEPLASVYQAEVEAGFVPGWVCETDFEFIETYAKRFQTPLLLKTSPDLEAIGLTYNYALGPQTVMLLARVEGEPVLVFAGSTRLVDQPPRVGDRRYRLFERQVGTVRLFELTPFAEPSVLDQFVHLPDWDPTAAPPQP